jgi:hypothetical protein
MRTAAGRAFQRSHWPLVLRADSFYKSGVRKDILFLTRFISLMGGLIAIAGVVTPLGLYQILEPAEQIQTPFQYIPDSSPFGYGTPPRSNFSFNRMCSDGKHLDLAPIPCPFSDTVAIITIESNQGIDYHYPYGYDLSIPQVILETYSSGTSINTTVSNFFDIQWRQYLTTSSEYFNNGSTYMVGSFRNMESLVLNNAFQPVEGLIVDTVNGGIGFRNHTAPPGFQYGVTWTEDLLFIEPETACVDTNLTLDFAMATTPNFTTIITELVLTDRGGFINLNHTFPEPNLIDPQIDPDLFGRAYKAAWLNNAITALYYNVTEDNNLAQGTRAWPYVNSSVNKTFSVPSVQPGYEGRFESLYITTIFGDYLALYDFDDNSTSAPSDSGPPTNPFNVTQQNFDDISELPIHS